MILRCCEQAKKIVHIPRVLCHCMENENGESHKQQKAGRQEEEHWKIIITEHSFRQLQSQQIKQDGTELIWQFSQSR
mgnify:CR=1 FL=1